MRELVGPTDDAAFDNSSGDPVLGELVPEDRYRKVFDFGCGCGRLARQLLQQRRRPRRYVGIDLHRGMQSFQNALYINPVDPTNAVIFDRGWVVESARELGLTVTAVTAPAIRGFHWQVLMTLDSRAEEAPFPGDEAPAGSLPPPVPGAGAEEIGLS